MPDLPTGTVTFLFTDLEASTELWERDPAAMREALARHDQLVRQAIERHDGQVFKTGGDAFCVAFGQAPDALAAALEAQVALHAEGWGDPGPLRARAALHTGSAEHRDGDYFGPALNRVARLLAIGHGGQILLSHSTVELVQDALPAGAALRDLGAHRLKDLQRPEQVFQLVHSGLPEDFPPLKSLDVLPNNLPLQPTSFIGRERELTELRRLLEANRLLTLTGAGGSGKTRLALQIAAELLESYPDGVWLVDLAALTDASLVSQTVATGLGVREVRGRPLLQTLVEWLKPRRLLLVLDNCEHVVASVAELVTALLRSCPGLTLLVTTREALGISGELVWPVPSLAVPDPRRLGLPPDRAANLTQYEAVRLFIERACLAKPDFAVTNQNAPAVAQICYRLDGIPLAIELAAGRVKALAVEQIATRLDDRFRLLTGGSRTALPRHQTLRAAMDWSYELLTEPERTLLRRLAVFAGGWTLEAAEAVCQGEGVEDWEVLELQGHLIDKSLVVVEPEAGGEAGYRLLATLRQYAWQRLVEAGESERLQDRHREWFLDLAERAEPELLGGDQALWLNKLELEHDNLRAALEAGPSNTGSVEARVRLAAAVTRFWYVRGHLSEGRRWLDEALSAGRESPPGPRAKALAGAGLLAYEQLDVERAAALYSESQALYRELGDKSGLARTTGGLGLVALYQGDEERAKALYTETLALAREIGATRQIAVALNNLGEVARLRGDYTAARALYEEALATTETDEGSKAVFRFNLGQVGLFLGDDAAAARHYRECLATSKKLVDRANIALSIEGFAAVSVVRGDSERAARLLGAAAALRKAINAPIAGADSPEHDRTVAAARAGTGEAAFAMAWAEGEAMTMEEAIEYAEGESEQEPARPAAAEEFAESDSGGTRRGVMPRS